MPHRTVRFDREPDEPLEDPDEEPLEAPIGDAEPARGPADPDPRVRWIYTPDMTSRTGWEAYLIRPPRDARRPVGFRPVRLRGDEDPGRSRSDKPARRRLE